MFDLGLGLWWSKEGTQTHTPIPPTFNIISEDGDAAIITEDSTNIEQESAP